MLIRILNALFRFNKRRSCPVCQNSFFAFYPIPEFYRNNWKKFGFNYSYEDFETLNAKEFSCPYCFSSDRERLYAGYLASGNFNNDINTLDIAPSKCLTSWIKKKMPGKYITADLFMEGVDYKVNVEQMDVFEVNKFDLIICSHVLEHVPNDHAAMSELFRVLKPGGQAIMMVPIVKSLDTVLEDPKETNVEERWRKFGQDDHIRLYNSSGFVSRLNKAGFKVKTFRAGAILPNCRTIGVNPSSVLYIAGK